MALKDKLLASVKRDVKHLMEEAVTRKCIHEESSSVVQLCASVDACLSHGLKRRALGLFKTSSTTALVQKIARFCPDAEVISKLVQETELNDSGGRFSYSGDSLSKISLSFFQKGGCHSTPGSISASCSSNSLATQKYLWIRLALFKRRLVGICEYLVANAQIYYERDALMADGNYGPLLCSLLEGPCALNYSSMDKNELEANEPQANELVQRHHISSGRCASSAITFRAQIINFKRNLNTGNDDSLSNMSSKSYGCASLAKDYVEGLYQGSKSTLVYGKNNVQVLPKDCLKPMNGYLSLHKHIQSLSIKWTPNQLMNTNMDSNALEIDKQPAINKDFYWNYALNISLDDIVYVHCHQNKSEDSGGTVILVSHDGVQRPPIIFPEGGHMQQFLACLETSLLPQGQLDPPLWSQKGLGRIFPWPRSVRSHILYSARSSQDEAPVDYVFRIVDKSRHEEFATAHSILDFVRSKPKRAHLSSSSTTGSSDCSSKSISIDQYSLESPKVMLNQSVSIEVVCSSMRRQIISRAFYGWLAYCRHLSTVRTHLSGLVHSRIITEVKSDEEGLTAEKWREFQDEGVEVNSDDILRLVYYGGVSPDLRKTVWPYLLGYYSFHSTREERNQQDTISKRNYETVMGEWLAVDAIVQQREKERAALTTAKLSSSSNSGQERTLLGAGDTESPEEEEEEELVGRELLENEVFLDTSDTSDGNEVKTGSPLKAEKELRKSPFVELKADKQHSLLAPVTRLMKTSTDSGNVEDDPVEEESVKTTAQLFRTARNVLDVKSSSSTSSYDTVENDLEDQRIGSSAKVEAVVASITLQCENVSDRKEENDSERSKITELKSACVSPASSVGGVYSGELLELFGLNLHRIEKDVQRCDRNYWYFAKNNLDKLRNVITTYVWEHLDIGYMQGMCDLVAPLLVIFDDESLTFSCFCKLMERMIENFPNGNAMDMHFANMRSLIQILDPEMYELMDSNGDYSHIYFCYRWFLLDFKRELLYEDVFAVWETIWSSKYVASSHFVLFLALALLETYRDIILSNSMDFTDIIKFFNEMAERHNVSTVLQLARNLVFQLQMILENK